jgi:hypothetical protein
MMKKVDACLKLLERKMRTNSHDDDDDDDFCCIITSKKKRLNSSVMMNKNKDIQESRVEFILICTSDKVCLLLLVLFITAQF